MNFLDLVTVTARFEKLSDHATRLSEEWCSTPSSQRTPEQDAAIIEAEAQADQARVALNRARHALTAPVAPEWQQAVNEAIVADYYGR